MRQPNILNYLPEVWSSVGEMNAHASAHNPELATLWSLVESAYNDQFLYTMGENGIKRWEKMLKISPMGTDTLEDRRFRILNRMNAQVPYTFRKVEAHLNAMCGADGYTMSYNPDNWTLTIKIALTSKKQFNEVLRMVSEMIPVNIVLDYGLRYNSNNVFASYTHAELTAYSHEAMRSEPF